RSAGTTYAGHSHGGTDLTSASPDRSEQRRRGQDGLKLCVLGVVDARGDSRRKQRLVLDDFVQLKRAGVDARLALRLGERGERTRICGGDDQTALGVPLDVGAVRTERVGQPVQDLRPLAAGRYGQV